MTCSNTTGLYGNILSLNDIIVICPPAIYAEVLSSSLKLISVSSVGSPHKYTSPTQNNKARTAQ